MGEAITTYRQTNALPDDWKDEIERDYKGGEAKGNHIQIALYSSYAFKQFSHHFTAGIPSWNFSRPGNRLEHIIVVLISDFGFSTSSIISISSFISDIYQKVRPCIFSPLCSKGSLPW